jgi:polyvinyl alcohol dehydrogenase (cytochrome)
MILDPVEEAPPIATGNPQSLAVSKDGSIYYADLDLVGTLPNVSPGPNGKVRRIRFDAMGDPLAPEIVRQNLAFPDGVAVLAGNFEPLSEWRTYAGGLHRKFFNPDEILITNQNVNQLQVLWTFPTGAIITGSPTIAAVDVPGEGPTQVVYFQSWDHTVYAVRMRDGSELWSVAVEDQPGASFPNVASADVTEVNGQDVVFIAAGEIMYALDATTGAEIWHFTAGTGCRDSMGNPPGLCGFSGERNEVESSAAVVDGLVFFGMDVNDVGTGKGGVYAVDALDGRLEWYFDLETGATCTPDPGDDIRNFDGYHSEVELDLPTGFLASRSGCNFDRTVTGCGNVWSSPSVDPVRSLLYFTSSNCDTDNDGGTPEPAPPMPAYDEAIVALGYDGVPSWVWRPREIDNDDLAFGSAPNLFTIDFGGGPREVLGAGNKDGTYYVLDRDGVNEMSGVAWNDVDPSLLPYWTTNVVPGGDIGGIILTAAVDENNDRIYFSTGPGTNAVNGPPADPQRPTVHALDMNTGAIAWDNSAETDSSSSFAPSSAIPGVAFFGEVPGAFLRSYDTENDDGSKLGAFDLSNAASASAPAVVDGIVLVGAGIGTRTSTGSGPSDITAGIASDLTALCVSGTVSCQMCGDGVVDWDEECDDGNLDDWDGCSASCESEDMWSFRGSAEGGSIFFIVDGVQLEVITVPGWTAGDVAAAVAAEILANATLLAQGVVVQVDGVGVSTNGTVTGVVVTDPGIDHIGQTLHIPNLPVQGWPWLLLALGCTGLYAIRRKTRA